MSNKFAHNCKYFAMPKPAVDLGQLKKMAKSAAKLYIYLAYKSDHHSKIEFSVSNREITEKTGLSANTIREARNSLFDLGLIGYDQEAGGTCRYTLNNPATQSPLVNMDSREERELAGMPVRKSRGKRTGKDLSKLTPEQYERYYRTHLPDLQPVGKEHRAFCRFHSETRPSLQVNFTDGKFHCFSCEVGGGVLHFERKVSECDDFTAVQKIAQILGDPDILGSARRRAVPEATYVYTDEHGEVLYQLLRLPGKDFYFQRLNSRGEWVDGLMGVKRVLYRLAEVVRASHVIVVEGEKDAENVRALKLRTPNGEAVAVTTNPHGAGKWKEEYSTTLAGKVVLVMRDEDKKGREHADAVVESVRRYASECRLLGFVEEGVKDVSDYLSMYGANSLLLKLDQVGFPLVLSEEQVNSTQQSGVSTMPGLSQIDALIADRLGVEEVVPE